ncbi:WRKY transcription factor 22-like [Curcuma longa]|uniref:WRKY transcription factor 22-like n=1 Tax=Curcuma longa TaxID=136217 RepID=UPI003D9F8B49
MDDNNWDLHAVVRAASSFAEEQAAQVSKDQFFSVFHELQDLCKPQQAPPPPPLLSLTAPLLPARRQQRAAPQTPRSKRRKNSVKKVSCQVPADGVHPDRWAWRKYGQKPIKGSPYPRGYYRCSSSKDCEAKKQVERSRADPEMLHITYTAEHNHPVPTHRNSLAGTTRPKPMAAVQAPAGGDLDFLDDHSFRSIASLTCSDAAAPADGHSFSDYSI